MPPLEKARVLVVHQDPLTRLGILGLIEAQSHLTACGEASEGCIARRLCCEQRPDIIILDLDVPHSGRLALIRDFRKLHPPVRLVALSGERDAASVLRAFQAGTLAYVLKNEPPKELLTAVEMVRNGNRYCSMCVTDALLGALQAGGENRPADELRGLSPREFDIFQLTGRHLGTTAIARELGISVKTVETHKKRIQEKLILGSADQLQARAVEWNGAKRRMRDRIPSS
jgi:DNA-binding NarL/FixJ family response regulator